MDQAMLTVFPLRYILFHHQTTTSTKLLRKVISLRYILFHHQTTTCYPTAWVVLVLRYILFHHQTTTTRNMVLRSFRLRYILFHHQTTTLMLRYLVLLRCVISSFITKPQPNTLGCNAQHVALYPLSSPNHNSLGWVKQNRMLRYILFHHQTTTLCSQGCYYCRCVISSFITKPQLVWLSWCEWDVALYPLSSPNHNSMAMKNTGSRLRYILFHHQTTTRGWTLYKSFGLRYILFHHQTTTRPPYMEWHSRLRYILFHHQTTTFFRCSLWCPRCVISSFITKPQLTYH